MARVFVSYAHRQPDESQARELASALRERHEVFIDTAIPGGRKWGEVIEQELHTADFLIPFLSSESVERPMVVDEISAAHELNVKFGRPGIVPIRLDSIKLKYPLSAYVNRFQEIRWLGPSDSPRVLTETFRALDQKSVLYLQSPERRQMIQRVRADWIDGILRKSLFEIAPISPVLQPEPRAIEHRVDAVIQRPDEEPIPLAVGTQLISVFDDHLGQLLILGVPGSGKTTLLLNLASELLDRAEADFNQPIPVVFNLSSWADRRPPLEEWLIEELRLRSDVPRQMAKKWVKEDQLLLLLDGLDEVAAAHRNGCVDAINAYRAEHGFVRIAVCSRVTEYQALTSQLRLPAAILIMPLSQPQVLEYLTQAGTPLEGVRAAVETDPGLWALLETPLTLSIVAIVGGSLPHSVAVAGAGQVPNPVKQRDQLFAYYVDAMFKRRTKETRYSPAQMRHWLTWLARMMVRREQTGFRIEDLRRQWLETRTARITILLATAIFVGLATGIFGALLFAVLADADNRGDIFKDTKTYVPYFMAIGFLLALFRGKAQKPVDLVEIRWPGYKNLMLAIAEGAILGGLLGTVFGWAGCYLNDTSPRDFMGDLHFGFSVFGALGAIAFGLGKAINTLATTRDLEIRPSPNYALSQSLRNTLGYIGVSLTFAAVGIVLLVVLPQNDVTVVWRIETGLGLVAWVNVLFGLEKGGYFLLDHFATRLYLWRQGRIPWNYLRFLDAAADRVFLRKVGAGYIFVHRMLLEYFASHGTAGSDVPKKDAAADTALPPVSS